MDAAVKTDVQAWLATPLGRRCLAFEQRLARSALERIFGEHCLQIGLWGERNSLLRYARTHRSVLLDWRVGTAADVISDFEPLAILSDSIDVVLLPHTLELADSPHSLLREVDRVLRADGHVVAFGFSPTGPWGLRHLLARDGYPPGHQRMIREGRLRDWLELLSFDVRPARSYLYTLPFQRFRSVRPVFRESWTRWLPVLAGGYLLSAQKRVRPLTPIRSVWRRRRLKVVGGLIEPTTRTRG